ncbi:hypothetical protein BaRGS_00030344 [Batillaria attramentaria]|uniref:Secreted protein n=1 Tax=Batillaria attramentaria TaxID=370345 RepID=A0ABD0JUQ6_9CAEN
MTFFRSFKLLCCSTLAIALDSDTFFASTYYRDLSWTPVSCDFLQSHTGFDSSEIKISWPLTGIAGAPPGRGLPSCAPFVFFLKQVLIEAGFGSSPEKCTVL